LSKTFHIFQSKQEKLSKRIVSARKTVTKEIKAELDNEDIVSREDRSQLQDLILSNADFVWINTIEVPTASNLKLIYRAKKKIPNRSKRKRKKP
jgi:hypothetical protein